MQQPLFCVKKSALQKRAGLGLNGLFQGSQTWGAQIFRQRNKSASTKSPLGTLQRSGGTFAYSGKEHQPGYLRTSSSSSARASCSVVGGTASGRG